MQPTFSSKELYFMNGGRTHYIHLDGYGDQYDATVQDEKSWREELIRDYLNRLDTETNQVSLKHLLDGLVYHQAEGLAPILEAKLPGAPPLLQLSIANCLWELNESRHSLPIIRGLLKKDGDGMVDFVFSFLYYMSAQPDARTFIAECLEGNDPVMFDKARYTLQLWGYFGIPALRDETLLARITPENRETAPEDFRKAVELVKTKMELE